MKNVFVILSLMVFGFVLNVSVANAQIKANSNKVQVDITVPQLDVNPYHRPYVAVWLETPNRQYVTTIALWADDMEWYKDLRQWWRKAGRSQQPYDGVTGATKKPGRYQIAWSGKDALGNTIPAGKYLLNIEASREEGGREFIKTPIELSKQGQLIVQGEHELGNITLTLSN